ncbi:MAG: hypothetical protein AAGB10_01375 [Pseudomonadota bacterium]
MTATFSLLFAETRRAWKRLLLWGLAFALLFQLLMLVALMARFQDVPNYIVFYDWPGNIRTIFQSTPSLNDALRISWEEWLIEIGYMNYDFGMGISEWSLNVVPSRLLVMFGLGALTGLSVHLMRRGTCTATTLHSSSAATGLGALMVAMTNATMSWVVCCATPSWVVGLAMLGLGVSTSLALETMGPLISGIGFALLFTMILFLAWRRAHPRATAPEMEGAAEHA